MQIQKQLLIGYLLKNFRLSLRTWLLIYSLIAMSIPLWFAIHAIDDIKHTRTESVLKNLQHQSDILTLLSRDQLEEATTALHYLASNVEITQTALARLYRRAQNTVRGNPAFTAVTLTNTNDQLLFNSNAPLAKNIYFSQSELTAQVFKTASPILLDVLAASQNEPPAIVLSAPLLQDNKLAYYLQLHLGLESFDRLLVDANLPTGWLAVMLDGQGRTIARSHDTNDFFEPSSVSKLLLASQKKDSNRVETIMPNGIGMTSLLRAIPGSDWRLAVAVPTEQLNALRLHMLRDQVLFTCVWLALSFLLSHLLSAYLLSKLEQVNSLMQKNSDPSAISLHIKESWQLIQTIALNQRNAQLVINNLAETSRQRDEDRILYEQAPCGYYSLDGDGKIIRINQTLSHWLGYQPSEMLGNKSSIHLASEGRYAFKQNLPTLLAQIKLKNQELVFTRKDGSEMPALLNAEAVFDAAGQFELIRVVVLDNTERKQAEQALADLGAREMETARQIQRTLLSAPQLSAHAGLWLSTFSQASRGVDGDFIDVTAVGEHLLDVLAGDVMGKGVPAALMGAAIKLQFSRSKSELFAQSKLRDSPPQPAEIVTAVNRAITPQLQALGAFATLIYLRIDTRENLLTWLGCGHEEALQISASGTVRRLFNQHPPLGLLSDERFTQDVCALKKGDALFLCSDGAADALLANGERLGREPVIASAINHLQIHSTPGVALHAIRRDLLPAGATLTDDLTMLLICHQSQPESVRLELPIALTSLLPLREFLTQQATQYGLDASHTNLLCVAGVELLTNVVAHGQGLLDEAPFELIATPALEGLQLDFKYLGERFESPAKLPVTDFSSYPESGLGLHIIQAVTRQIGYRFEDGVNSVRLMVSVPSRTHLNA